MSKSSKFTKKCLTTLWILRIFDFIFLFVPLFVYIVIGLTGTGVIAAQKVALIGSVSIALILVLFNVIAQKRLRCPIWIILIGLYVIMKGYLMPLIIMLAVGSVLDDLVFTPLISYHRTRYIASKTDDEKKAYESRQS